MLILNKTFSRIPVSLFQVATYSVNIVDRSNTIIFKSNFTTEEQEKVLNILNESNHDQLIRFSIPQNRIKNLVNWKSKRGPFKTLSDVLQVDGLGEKVLEKICQQIITDSENKLCETNSNTNNFVNKRLKQLVTPPFNGSLSNKLQSAVGIHLLPMGISWAKLTREQNKLTDWSYESLSMLPNKMLPVDNFNLAMKIIHKLPCADAYILETNPLPSPQSAAQSITATSYAQQLELSSMLFALINTSVRHNPPLRKSESTNGIQEKDIENKVFHLRSKTPARLFRTLIGTEKVAALTVINELVEYKPKEFSLPCTPIKLEQNVKDGFVTQSSANKELLGQALLLVVSFMDLCIYKNSVSQERLLSNKKNL